MKRTRQKPSATAKPISVIKPKGQNSAKGGLSRSAAVENTKRNIVTSLPTTSKSKPPRTKAQYTAKPKRFKQTWDRVISTVAKMRAEKISLAQASRETGIGPRTVRRWASSALRKRPNGTFAAKASDNFLRMLLIPTPDGTREIAVGGSKQARLIAEYWNALHRYLQTGDARKLKSFEGKQIKDADGNTIALSVDLPALNRLGSAGVLSFESIYARTA